MRYDTGRQMQIGEEVIADGMHGVIVCDFDHRQSMSGYEHWVNPTVELHDGDILSSGVMIRTEEAGLIHYRERSCDIEFVRVAVAAQS